MLDITINSYRKTNNPKNLKTYNNLAKVKGDGVKEPYLKWEVEEFEKCKACPVYFIENYVILEGEGGSENFTLRDYQRDTIEDLKTNRFVVVLAPRRAGKSLCVLGYALWFSVFNSNKTVYVLSKTHDDSIKLLAKLKLMYQSLPFFMQPGVVNYAAESVELSNGTKLLTSSANGIRGDAADIIIADEIGFLPNGRRFYEATYPVMADRKNSKFITMSTPNGQSNILFDLYQGAVKGLNTFLAIRWRWEDVPTYASKPNFKEETISNIGIEAWRREYECEFLSTSNTLVDGQCLQRLESSTPVKVYGNSCNVYEEPKDRHKYILNVDVSDGVGKDSSVIQIIDITKKPYTQVAVYRNNKVSPFELDTIVVHWAKKYNNGFVVVEVNQRGADVANRILYDHGYENLFIRDPLKPNGLGIDMKANDKRKGCVSLKSLIETEMLKLNDETTINELRTFEITNTGSYAGANGLHDDTVMALVVFSIFTGMPVFRDIQGSDRDINETVREIKVAQLPQDLLLGGFCSNYSNPFNDMNNIGSLYGTRGGSDYYDDVNFYYNDGF